MKKLIQFFILYALCSGAANAVQEYRVKDGESVTVTISSNDLTRIAMHGDSRIEQVWGNKEDLEIQPDKERGQLYIKPLTNNPALSFFVRDTEGSTYTIIAKQANIPSETVILKSGHRKTTKGYYKSETYIESINRLIKAMALEADLEDYSSNRHEHPVRLWRGFDIKLVSRYNGQQLVGETYVIHNKTGEKVSFHESEFFSFGEDVRAVSLESLDLVPGESTSVFVIRGATE